MRFCPDCGTGHDCEAQTAPGPSDAVRIAEIERDRDIALAKLSARQDKDWNETRVEVAEIEADAEVVAAVAAAEGMADAIDAMTPDPPAADPIVIDAPPPAEEAPATDVPPVVEHEAADSKPKTRGLGMWG